MEGQEEENRNSGTIEREKPRRLEEDTITYLIKILPELDSQLDSSSSEDLDVLVENVLLEIKQRSASAMCDRRTFIVMEKLCFASSLKNLLVIFERASPYTIFLARNRHSSHVLQAMYSRLSYILKFQGLIGNVDEKTLEDQILQFSRPLFQEISWLIKDLNASHVIRSCLCTLSGLPTIAERKGKGSKHQHSVSLSEPLEALKSPSHFYIDSKFCFEVPSSIKEYMSTALLPLLSSEPSELQMQVADPTSCAVLGLIFRIYSNPSFYPQGPSELISPLVSRILDWDAAGGWRELVYAMAGDKAGSYFLETTFECASLPLVLRVLSQAIIPQFMEYVKDGCANFVVQSAFRRLSSELSQLQQKQQPTSAMPSKKQTSVIGENEKIKYEIESILEQMLSVIFGFAPPADGRAVGPPPLLPPPPFLLTPHHIQLEGSSFSSEPLNASLRSLTLSKGGVVLWMLEASSLLDHSRLSSSSSPSPSPPSSSSTSSSSFLWGGFLAFEMIRIWTRDLILNEGGGEEEQKQKKPKKIVKRIESLLLQFLNTQFSPTSSSSSSSTSSSPSDSTSEGLREGGKEPTPSDQHPQSRQQRDTKQLLLARLLSALVRLASLYEEFHEELEGNQSSSPSPSSIMITHILRMIPTSLSRLDPDTLVSISQSGPLSRALLDPLFELISSPSSLSSSLLESLLGQFPSPHLQLLSTHYVGQHILHRVFDLCSVPQKEKLLEALQPVRERMPLSKEGRNTLRWTQWELFSRRPEEWRGAMHRQGKAVEMLRELEGKTAPKQSATTPSPSPSSSSSSSSSTSTSTHYPTRNEKEKGKGKRHHLIFKDEEYREAGNNENQGVEEDEEEVGEGEAVKSREGTGENEGKRKRKRKRKNFPSDSSVVSDPQVHEIPLPLPPSPTPTLTTSPQCTPQPSPSPSFSSSPESYPFNRREGEGRGRGGRGRDDFGSGRGRGRDNFGRGRGRDDFGSGRGRGRDNFGRGRGRDNFGSGRGRGRGIGAESGDFGRGGGRGRDSRDRGREEWATGTGEKRQFASSEGNKANLDKIKWLKGGGATQCIIFDFRNGKN